MEKTINKINSSGKVRLEIVGSASKIPSKSTVVTQHLLS